MWGGWGMRIARAFCATYVVVALAYSLAFLLHTHPQWRSAASLTARSVANRAQHDVVHPALAAGHRELVAFFDAIDPQPLRFDRPAPRPEVSRALAMENIKPLDPRSLAPLRLPHFDAQNTPAVELADNAPGQARSNLIPQPPMHSTVGALTSEPPELLTHGAGGVTQPVPQPATGPVIASIAPRSQTAPSELWRSPASDGGTPSSLAASSEMPMGLPTEAAPAGFISFCSRYPGQCGGAPNDPQKIHLDLAVQTVLKSVTRSVNSAIGPEDDLRHYGVAEYWDLPADGYGNCKDYALVKRKELIAAGLPERALRLAIVVVPREGRHVVLTVATDKGDFVLDNLNDDVRPWTDVSYRWLERQDTDGGLGWVTFSPDLVAAATTNRTRPDGPALPQILLAQQSVRTAQPVLARAVAPVLSVSLGPDELKHVLDRLRASLTAEMYDNFGLFLYVSKAETGPWAQHMFVFAKEPAGGLALKYAWLVSTGREAIETNRSGARMQTTTPSGYFQLDPERLYRNHVSAQWGTPMPFAMFFNWTKNWSQTGLAIDATTGDGTSQLGKRATPGSIHLSPENAATLFGMVKEQYRGPVPRFAFDQRTGSLSNDGVFARDGSGRLQYTQGYKVLVFIENRSGGENVVAALF
jgi:predicted transglutaminase-like cysteine proteinase